MVLRPSAIGKSAPPGDLAEIADADTPVSANWTVKEAGGITPPTSDDYGTWTEAGARERKSWSGCKVGKEDGQSDVDHT
ncbi:unnamed protein product [Phytophthora fragariaefolia]|uniref:Unnamed protein product n=1 Tax=Phytophthora fragariaefolia TaxID=1490495 RepID=A0A9W7CPN9_9STRA|nr:unnamed protein product [Phytophthora fragariaefolia]